MVKVKVVGCSILQIGNEKYATGDVIEVPESMLEASPDLYEKIEKPKKATPTIAEEQTAEPAGFPGILAEVEKPVEPKETKKRRRRS